LVDNYEKILTSVKSYDFYTPALKTYENYPQLNRVFLETTAFVTAPSMVAYILWVLNDAIEKKINTLYFLARDGLIMYKIAQKLVQIWGLKIKCKYLYCSRKALWLPLYVLDREYALEKLFQKEYHTNLHRIYARMNISEDFNFGIDVDVDKMLSDKEIQELKEKLLKNDKFLNVLETNSQKAYAELTSYLNQEINTDNFAIVDSGWIGSMQKCLSKIYPNIVGYYFGMFIKKMENYNSFLFDADNIRKILGFSNNLFECLCAANHGMTIGYEQKENKWVAVLADNTPISGICNPTEQIDIAETYAGFFAQKNSFTSVSELRKFVKSLLVPFMGNPTYEQAKIYGDIPFSDGWSEENTSTLARKLSKKELKQFTLTHKVYKVITRQRGKNKLKIPIYWIGGAIVLSGCKGLTKINVTLSEYVYWILS
jgi:predicted HAD superfamily hydrolase